VERGSSTYGCGGYAALAIGYFITPLQGFLRLRRYFITPFLMMSPILYDELKINSLFLCVILQKRYIRNK
jgi:hypothetical protein